MQACRIAVAAALLSMAVATPFAAKSASLRVGITIVETCDVQTLAYAQGDPLDAVRADCSADTPFSVALGGHPAQDDGRSRPALVPDDDVVMISADRRLRIATFTF